MTLSLIKAMPSTLLIIEPRINKQTLIKPLMSRSYSLARIAAKLKRKSRWKSFLVTIRVALNGKVMKAGCAAALMFQKVNVLSAWARKR